MKAMPKLIYVYWEAKNEGSQIKKYEFRVYEPANYHRHALGQSLFEITSQSNTDRDHNRGLFKAYAWYFERIPLERPSVIPIVAKLAKAAVQKDNAVKPILKALKQLGAVRYALGRVEDPKSYNNKEFMPRKFAGSKSKAYWQAITAGLEVN